MGGSAAHGSSSRDKVEGSAACGPGVYVWLQVGPDGGDASSSTQASTVAGRRHRCVRGQEGTGAAAASTEALQRVGSGASAVMDAVMSWASRRLWPGAARLRVARHVYR
ncbi:Os01g0175766 [Oryza sativa Japonica Group]|uniref:Os01g0175766 protein n=1 Tax=Oryza sativa subsp. japonica TaxID=39947 RepID=A0A0P0UYQ8_ORYSJ|nr:Os01g0175766 [Oryza sativa Japonica Group]